MGSFSIKDFSSMKRIAFIDSWLGVALLREFVFSCVFFNLLAFCCCCCGWYLRSYDYVFVVILLKRCYHHHHVCTCGCLLRSELHKKKDFYWTHSFFWMNEITFKLERLCCQEWFMTGHHLTRYFSFFCC